MKPNKKTFTIEWALFPMKFLITKLNKSFQNVHLSFLQNFLNFLPSQSVHWMQARGPILDGFID